MDLVIEQIGGMCPVQGYGTLNGERFYFRYRHDDAQLHVGPPDSKDPIGLTDRLYAEICCFFNEHERGWLDDDQAVELIHQLIPLLRPIEEFRGQTYQDRLAAQVDALIKADKAVNN